MFFSYRNETFLEQPVVPRAVLVLLEWHSPARDQCQVSWLKPASCWSKTTEEPERRILHLRILCFLDNTGLSEERKRKVLFSWPIHELYPRSRSLCCCQCEERVPVFLLLQGRWRAQHYTSDRNFPAAFGSKDSLWSLVWGGIFSKADPPWVMGSSPTNKHKHFWRERLHEGVSTSPPAQLRKAKQRQWWQFVQQQGKQQTARGWGIRAVWKEGWQPARDNPVQFATLLISNKDKAAEWFSLERLELSCQWLWLIDSTPAEQAQSSL